eukprot:513041_1
MKSMDWATELPSSYLEQLKLIHVPDTAKIYIEYCSIHRNNLHDPFIKMMNIIFYGLFMRIESLNYIELVNKTKPQKHFTRKLQSFKVAPELKTPKQSGDTQLLVSLRQT